MVLEPTIGAFDFAFGRSGKGVGDFDREVVHDLFPLGFSLVGEDVVFAPDGVAALDEAEDRVGVGVVLEGAAKCGDQGLCSVDVEPGGFSFKEVAVEDAAAVVIQ